MINKLSREGKEREGSETRTVTAVAAAAKEIADPVDHGRE